MKSATSIVFLALVLAGCKKDETTTTTTSSESGTSITTVTPASINCTSTNAEQVVCAANAFIGSLSATQQSTAVLTHEKANAVKWSNLPCGSNCRVGIQLSTLSSEQLAYAKALLKVALGSASGTGFDQVLQILAADDVLGQSNNGYSSGIYFLSLLGTPSTSNAWQLQFGGHHLAVSVTYKAGTVTGASPFFIGVEPKTWASNGTTYAPLGGNQSALATMLNSLSSTELASAKLSTTFGDVVLGPNKDGQFPSTKVGLKAGALTSSQKSLILAAISFWVKNVDDATATTLMQIYTNELDDTYIAYSGNASLSNNADYVRIDGPSVWIEFVCQSGVIYQNEIHYHSVYRDHTRDYGGSFSF